AAQPGGGDAGHPGVGAEGGWADCRHPWDQACRADGGDVMAAAGWKTYDSYKDGHSEWLEKVPSHWSEKPLKHLGFLYAGIIGKSGDDFSKEQRDGFLPFVPFVSVANFLRIPPRFEYVRATKDEAQNRVQKGDLIFL